MRVQGSKIQGLRVEDSRDVRIEAQWNVVASAEQLSTVASKTAYMEVSLQPLY